MTSRRQLHALIAADPSCAHLAGWRLDHAIVEIRRLRMADKVYWGVINRANEYEETYESE